MPKHLQLPRVENKRKNYLANKHFEHRMLKNRVALELINLLSARRAVDLLLQGIICNRLVK